ncbi:hypothetical protein F4805DRAFT_413225 [Annulohypoxylon moriforme]|nr:hypothetical protein F4805DRAFT_413225 [Annulohypoxylon moriforme]
MANATRLISSLVLLINSIGNDNFKSILADTIATGSVMVWDFSKTVGKGPYVTVPMSYIVMEIIISLGIFVDILVETVVVGIEQEGSYLDPILTGSVLTWSPVLILSCILVYCTVTEYLQTRHHGKQRPIIVFTKTGDPVVVIPEPRSCYHSAFRFSVDSLIQESAVQTT